MSYGKVKDTFWTDSSGRRYRVPTAGKKLRAHINSAHAALRAHVFQRDGFTCRQCGVKPRNIPSPYDGRSTMFSWSDCRGGLHIDHILARSKGGTNHPDNLQTLCMSCNSAKRDRRIAA